MKNYSGGKPSPEDKNTKPDIVQTNTIPLFPDMGELFNSSVVASSISLQNTSAVADDTKNQQANEEDIEVFAGDLISVIMKSWQYHVSQMPNNTATKKK